MCWIKCYSGQRWVELLDCCSMNVLFIYHNVLMFDFLLARDTVDTKENLRRQNLAFVNNLRKLASNCWLSD